MPWHRWESSAQRYSWNVKWIFLQNFNMKTTSKNCTARIVAWMIIQMRLTLKHGDEHNNSGESEQKDCKLVYVRLFVGCSFFSFCRSSLVCFFLCWHRWLFGFCQIVGANCNLANEFVSLVLWLQGTLVRCLFLSFMLPHPRVRHKVYMLVFVMLLFAPFDCYWQTT